MPLAIELAAPLVKMLAPWEVLARLDDALPALDGPGAARDLPARQRTMRAAVSWSYGLLGEDEREAFRRLSVFSGGFTLGAARAVCEDPRGFDAISSLMDKSLISARELREGEMRFWMLKVIRDFGTEQLGRGVEEEQARKRHAGFFLKLAEEAETGITGPHRRSWLKWLELEHDNLRAALRWTGDNNVEMGLRLANALHEFWVQRGYPTEGRMWLERALDATALSDSPVVAKALCGAGTLAWQLGDQSAARSRLEEGMALYRKLGDESGVAFALYLSSLPALSRGDLAAARSLAEQSVDIYRREGGADVRDRPRALSVLGIVASAQQDYAAARAALEESAGISRKAKDEYALAGALGILGLITHRQGDHDRAVELLEECLGALRGSPGDTFSIFLYLEILAMVEAERGYAGRAARLFGTGEALRERIGATVTGVYRRDEYDHGVAAAREGLGQTDLVAAWSEGRAMTLEEAIAYALDEPAMARK